MCVCVEGVIKMENTVPRAGIELTYLAFGASVLPIQRIGFPDVTTIPMPTCLYCFLPHRSMQPTTYTDSIGPI